VISLEKAVIARLTKAGERFEVLVDPENALKVKGGKDIPLDELVASEEVYEDARKGLRSSSEKINKIFGTNDIETIVKRIIREGEIQITTEQRRRMLEEKRRAIATIISKRGVNPQTGLPHPPERILRAMEEAKVRIDLERGVEEQIEGVLKAIQTVIPIKFEKVKIAIKIPPAFTGKACGVVRNLGSLLKEEWASDGSYLCLLEIPSGIQQEVYDRLNNLTHGQVEVKIIKKGD
jgi:ribosome maturation protein SDO1